MSLDRSKPHLPQLTAMGNDIYSQGLGYTALPYGMLVMETTAEVCVLFPSPLPCSRSVT